MTLPTQDLSSRLKDVVERGDFVVPAYPAAAMRLRTLIESDKFGLAQIADAAAADAVLAATLLRIANSAMYRGEGPPFTTLLRAVNRLGARSVSSLALAAGVGAAASSPGPLSDVKYRVWRRSITCALCAQAFGPGRGIDAEEAFLAGLLHGFGRAIAVACIEQLLVTSAEKRSASEWLEVIEPHRAALAQRVAELWKLPEPIALAIGTAPGAATPSAVVVALADRLAGALDRGVSAAELASDPGLKPAESARLDAFVAGLPSALEALVQTPDANKKSRVANAVTKSPSLLAGEHRRLTTAVVDLRKGREPDPFESIAVAPLGLVLTSSRPIQESSVIRVSVQTTPVPFDAWFNVLLCAPEGKRYRIELSAFAASSDVRDLLGKLWSSAAKLP